MMLFITEKRFKNLVNKQLETELNKRISELMKTILDMRSTLINQIKEIEASRNDTKRERNKAAVKK